MRKWTKYYPTDHQYKDKELLEHEFKPKKIVYTCIWVTSEPLLISTIIYWGLCIYGGCQVGYEVEYTVKMTKNVEWSYKYDTLMKNHNYITIIGSINLYVSVSFYEVCSCPLTDINFKNNFTSIIYDYIIYRFGNSNNEPIPGHNFNCITLKYFICMI